MGKKVTKTKANALIFKFIYKNLFIVLSCVENLYTIMNNIIFYFLNLNYKDGGRV